MFRSTQAALSMALLLVSGCEQKPDGTEPSVASASFEPAPARAPEPSGVKPAPTAEGTPAAKPFLWEVSRDGKTVWLFGTMHLGIESSQLPKGVWDKLRDANAFVMEMDIGDPALAAEIARAGTLPPDKSLEAELGPELWLKTTQATGPSIPPAALTRLEPWIVSVNIVSQFLPKTEPLDLALLNRAKEEGDTLSYLETWQEQVQMLEQSMDVEVLKDIVIRLDDQRAMALAMHRTYLDGDEEAFAKAAFDPAEMKRHPELYDRLFFQRNDRWMPKLEAHLAKGDAFIAVGAGHLVGERGLIALLEKRGATAQRLGPPAP